MRAGSQQFEYDGDPQLELLSAEIVLYQVLQGCEILDPIVQWLYVHLSVQKQCCVREHLQSMVLKHKR